jgi:hypothetical protein
VVVLASAASAASAAATASGVSFSIALVCIRCARRPSRRLRTEPSGCGSLSPRLNTMPMYFRFVCFFGSR